MLKNTTKRNPKKYESGRLSRELHGGHFEELAH